MEGVGQDFMHLLQTHLETQSLEHERELSKLSTNHIERIEQLETLLHKRDAANTGLLSSRVVLEQRLRASQDQGMKTQKKLDKLNQSYLRLSTAFEEEQALNADLRRNMDALNDASAGKDDLIRRLEEEVLELKDQVRDVFVFLETQKAVAGLEDIREGSVVGVSSAPVASVKRGKGKSRK